MVKVSVIIPVFNCELFIEKCISSILRQTLDNIEIIIVNDGCTDDSLNIINKCITGHEDKCKVINQKNQGVSIARNNALELASGKYIAFIDGDDYIDAEYLEKLFDSAETNVSDMVFCGYKRVDSLGNVIDCNEVKQLASDESYVYKMMTICMRLFRREFLNKHNLKFPVGVRGEDIPFNMTVDALGANITAISYTGYNYVQHESSAMKKLTGLKNFKLPVSEIGETILYIRTVGCKNSYDFFELSVMRSFAMFVFQFGIKSEKADLSTLCNEISSVLDTYCPKCYENSLLSVRKLKKFPLSHRMAVKLFAWLYKMNLLYKGAYLLTRR